MNDAILSLNIESYTLPCIEIMQCNHFNCALDSRVDSRTWILVRNKNLRSSYSKCCHLPKPVLRWPISFGAERSSKSDLHQLALKASYAPPLKKVDCLCERTSWRLKQVRTSFRCPEWRWTWHHEPELQPQPSHDVIPTSDQKVPSYRSNLLCLALGLFITSEPLAPKYVAHLRITPLSTLVLEASTNAPATE